jgi:TonB family protein
MKSKIAGVVFLGLCAVLPAPADVTLRYTITLKFGSFLPPQAVDAMKQQLSNRMPEGSTVQIKGDRVCVSMGQLLAIADYAKGVITILDPKTSRFATLPLAEYPARILAMQNTPAMPPDAQRIFDNMKFDVKTSKTGQTATLLGIRTEEHLLTISMELPAGMTMRTEIHNWTATPDELQRSPELRELAAFVGRPQDGLAPMEMLTKSLSGVPGIGEKLRGPMQEIAKAGSGAALRMRSATFMPAMAQSMGAAAADEPLTEFAMDLAEFSAAPIPLARFEVPAGYQTAAMEDLLGAMFGAPQPAPQVAAKTDPALGSGVYRPGNGVSSPTILEREEPSYTEAARAAKIQGTVLMQVVVAPDGTAGQIEVVRSVDVGLDQRAVEAVSKWKFKPGIKDGQPVSVQITVEVSFHLL